MDPYTLLLLALNLSTCTSYLLLASLLEAEFDGRNIKSYYFGYIIASYGLFAIVSSFYVPSATKLLGRSKVLYLGLILSVIFIVLMAFLPYIENNSILIFVAIILRAGQGFFRMYVVVPSTIIFVILYPKERVRYVGYKE